MLRSLTRTDKTLYNENLLENLLIYTWDRDSDIIHCSKGICVFVNVEKQQEFLNELKHIIKKVG